MMNMHLSERMKNKLSSDAMKKTLKFEFDLTTEEIRLIAYWRESCHIYNSYCPLKGCLGDKGIGFCHRLCDKIAKVIEKELGKAESRSDKK